MDSLPKRNCLVHSFTVEYEGEDSPYTVSKRCLISVGLLPSFVRNLMTASYSILNILEYSAAARLLSTLADILLRVVTKF
jgi:hypothetical protein